MASSSSIPPKRPAGHAASKIFGPGEKPQNFSLTMATLWRFVAEEKRALAWIAFLVLLSNVFQLLAPYLLGRSVDAISSSDASLLTFLCLSLAAVYFLGGALQMLEGFFMANASQRIIFSIREALFDKLRRLDAAFFDQRSPGDLLSRFTSDVDAISTTLSDSVVSFLNAVLTLVGCGILMIRLSLPLFLCALLTLPLIALLTRFIAQKTADRFRAQQSHIGHLAGFMEEGISGFELTKAFAREQETQEVFDALNSDLAESSYAAQLYAGLLMPMMNVINNLGYVLIAFVGGYLAVDGHVSLGVIASFLAYVRRFNRPLIDIASIFNTLQSAAAGAERIFAILDEAEEKGTLWDSLDGDPYATNAPARKDLAQERRKKKSFVTKDSNASSPKEPQMCSASFPALPSSPGDIVFHHVCFGYLPDKEVLHDVSFTVKAGQTVALVGSTGAGKTTLVQLLTQLYQPNRGQILMGNVPIVTYDRRKFRTLFGYVPQDPRLFRGTVQENIAYGKQSASQEDIRQTALLTGCHDFIQRLPQGYGTELCEDGDILSQGEKQLLTIARAVLPDPPILILDEATSSVDTRTELLIQETLRKLGKERTTFLIAHRLSTIRSADKILVIEGGELIEEGSHEQLMALNGRYASLVKSQKNNES